MSTKSRKKLILIFILILLGVALLISIWVKISCCKKSNNNLSSTIPIIENNKQQNSTTLKDSSTNYEIITTAKLKNSKGDIIEVSYLDKNNQRMVLIRKNKGQIEYLLPQKEAWAKGAIYSNNNISWRGDRSNGILTEGSISTKYIPIH